MRVLIWLLLAGALGQPSLLDATREGHTRQVSAIVSAGTDLDEVDASGRTALMIASVEGHLEIVAMLIDAGADVSLRDNQGIDALTLAKAAREHDVVDRLRAGGAVESPEVRLHEAIQAGELEAVTALITDGVDVNAIDTEHYRTPLMAAVASRQLEILLRLVDAGGDPTREGTGIETAGENAISSAARQASPWALRVLLEAKARQRDKDRALLLGCHVRAVVDVALQSGADVETRDVRGKTPLICAAALGATDAITALLSAGADRDAVDENGRTAHDWAQSSGHRETQAQLAR